MKKICLYLVMGTLFTLFLGFSTATEAQQTVTIRAVMAWPETYTSNGGFKDWVNRVNEQERARSPSRWWAVRKRCPFSSSWSAKEGRGRCGQHRRRLLHGHHTRGRSLWPFEAHPGGGAGKGFYDVMVEAHRQHGYMYLGRMQGLHPWGSSAPRHKPKAPKIWPEGRFALFLSYDAFLKEMGAVPVTIPVPEIYTALERGSWTDSSSRSPEGLHRSDFTKSSTIDRESLFLSAPRNGPVQYRLLEQAFSGRPEPLDQHDQRDGTGGSQLFHGTSRRGIQKAQKAGVTLINFSKDDAKSFVDAAYRTGWENLLKKAPKYGPKLQEVSTK